MISSFAHALATLPHRIGLWHHARPWRWMRAAQFADPAGGPAGGAAAAPLPRLHAGTAMPRRLRPVLRLIAGGAGCPVAERPSPRPAHLRLAISNG